MVVFGAIGEAGGATSTKCVRTSHVQMVPPSAAVRTPKIYLLAAEVAGLPVDHDSHLVLAIEGDEDTRLFGAQDDRVWRTGFAGFCCPEINRANHTGAV